MYSSLFPLYDVTGNAPVKSVYMVPFILCISSTMRYSSPHFFSCSMSIPSVSRFCRYSGTSFLVDLRFWSILYMWPMWVACVSVTYFDMLALVSRVHSGRIPLLDAVNSVLFAQLLKTAWWNCIASFNLFVLYTLAIELTIGMSK